VLITVQRHFRGLQHSSCKGHRQCRLTGWIHIPCFAQTLNLVVSEAIKADASVHGHNKKCKQIEIFHHSVKFTEKLKEIQGQSSIPDHNLIQGVETRWNSTYYMFQRITDQHQAVTTTLRLANRNNLELLKAAHAVLKPFEAITREVLISMVLFQRLHPSHNPSCT